LNKEKEKGRQKTEGFHSLRSVCL